MRPLPVVAIIGRPNVGKSTLFNRLVGERLALVSDIPGLTRDRHYARAEYAGRPFILTDTGGYELETHTELGAAMRAQTMHALDEADAIIFLVDVHSPGHPVDTEILSRLRRAGRKFFMAVNKCENERLVTQAYADFSEYGLDELFPLSALHGDGLYDMMDVLTKEFPARDPQEDFSTVRVAIVGRQNVGKSTLVNRLLGEERVIASAIAGTTRDAIDTEVTVDGQQFTLIDTAGIRRRSRVERGAEMLSVFSSLHAIERAEVVLLLLDATRPLSEQDAHIAGYITERGRAAVIVLNKWDALEKTNETHGEFIARVRDHFNFMKWAPILTISARTGQRAPKLWGLIRHASQQFRREFQTALLNLIVRKATSFVSPPTRAGSQLRIKYACQTGFRPPAISLFVNDPNLAHFSYQRYLENQFRAQLELDSTPLYIKLRRKSPPRGWEKGAAIKPEHEVRAAALAPGEDFAAGFVDEDDGDFVWIEPGSEP